MCKTFCVLQILLSVALIHVAMQNCYKMRMLTYISEDTQNYRMTMAIHNNNTVSSLTSVYKEIPIPMWHIKFMQHSRNRLKIHYNATIKTCEFWKFLKRVRVFREVATIFSQPENGNLSFKCPMPVGRYVLRNLFVPPDSNFLKFIYNPNTIYTLYLAVLSRLSNNRMEKLCSYEINGTITKAC